MGLSLKAKFEVTKINRPKAAFIKHLDIECGDILEVSLAVDENKYAFHAKAVNIFNTRNGMKLENYSFTMFAKNFSYYNNNTFEYNEL